MGQPLYFETNLQNDVTKWKSNSAPDINDPASDHFEATQEDDGSMVVTNCAIGDKKFAGALVSNTVMKVPTDANGKQYQYIAFRVRWRWSKAVARQIARHELDLKVCYLTRPPKPPGSNENPKIRNVANCSTQWNRDTGQFQIDKDPPGWVDSGYIVKDIAPDVDHELDYRFYFNPDNQTFSVLSIKLDTNEPYLIPKELQDVAMTLGNWEECRKLQVQNEIYKPGASVIHYHRIDLGWSHEPMDATINWSMAA